MILLERRWERRLHCSPYPPFRAKHGVKYTVSTNEILDLRHWVKIQKPTQGYSHQNFAPMEPPSTHI